MFPMTQKLINFVSKFSPELCNRLNGSDIYWINAELNGEPKLASVRVEFGPELKVSHFKQGKLFEVKTFKSLAAEDLRGACYIMDLIDTFV